MVKKCPHCASVNITFIESGADAGKHFCEDCGYTGEVLFGRDEFAD
ncbi:MAG: hypothetical protein PHC66_01840 [Candidatus Nanoarchaeia archaeon]|nr:hypothetical protein [Candidatus Nanoarchaeia archaeon]MDD5239029.1 hypothetical protein [Candidatus Nanoarchaeia archaeon]